MKCCALLLLLAACSEPAGDTTPERDAKARTLIARTRRDRPERERRLACVALGRLGGKAARDRLVELLRENTRQPQKDGPVRLYAAAGLTILRDPSTCVRLLQALSTINPDDNIAALASEERSEEYFTVDAQICEALLAMGRWEAEEELVSQLRRRDRIRVAIDAYAVLRRRTGLKLRFRYNGSYADREADAAAWQERLRATRAQRRRKKPFDAHDPLFVKHFQAVVDDLGKESVNNELIAQKIVLRVGLDAIPFLVRELGSDNLTAQRQAALMLGRIGSARAASALRAAVVMQDAAVRSNAIDALRSLEDDAALEVVGAALEDRDAGVRAAAANYLALLGSAEQRAALRAALAREQAPATATALRCALLRLGDRDQLDPLLAAFVDGQQHDRAAALAAIESVFQKSVGATALSERAERARAAARVRNWR